MPMLDVFKTDAFNSASLTSAINKLPFKPSRLGALGIFNKSGIYTTVVSVEERSGKLVLVPNAARATLPNLLGQPTRKMRAFNVTNLPLSAEVFADDVQNIRKFGEEQALEAVVDLVNDKQQMLRQSIEYTHEYHRVGAMKGILLDADGTTIYNFFTEFGTSQPTEAIDFTGETTNAIKKMSNRLTRKIQDALGATTYDHIHVMCGSTFYDNVVCSTEVKTAYERWSAGGQQGAFLRDSQVRDSFPFAGITWEEYRGKWGTTPFIAATEAYAFPVGADGVFEETYAPAPFNETVNTKGKPIYTKQETKPMDMGINILAISCPLIYCARPDCLYKLSQTGTPTRMVLNKETGEMEEEENPDAPNAHITHGDSVQASRVREGKDKGHDDKGHDKDHGKR